MPETGPASPDAHPADAHPAADQATRRSFAVGAVAALAGAAVATLASSSAAQQGVSPRFAVVQPGGLLILDSIQDMQAFKVGNHQRAALVLGYSTLNDGGGGVFYWDPVSTDTQDGGVVFASFTSVTGRRIRLAM